MTGCARSPEQGAETMVEEFVGQSGYPCLGARSVLKRRRATVGVYRQLGAAGTTPALLADLRWFAASTDPQGDLASFIATFQGPRIADEQHFEGLLWRHFHQCLVGAQRGAAHRPPSSRPGDRIVLRAEMDLHVGLTACSAEKSNGGICKPIDFYIQP